MWNTGKNFSNLMMHSTKIWTINDERIPITTLRNISAIHEFVPIKIVMEHTLDKKKMEKDKK